MYKAWILNILLIEQKVNEEIKREIKIFHKIIKMKAEHTKNFNTAKALRKGKSVAIST
jgi:hypothetical protein